MNTTSEAPHEVGHRHLPVWLMLAFSFGLLMFAVPYAAGYGEHRLTLWRWLLVAWSDPTWQHSALAAPTSAFLVWRMRLPLSRIQTRGSLAGLTMVIAALFLFWTGFRGNFYYIGYAAMQLLLAGTIVWLWGWRHFRAVIFAWLMLAFAWPFLFLEDTLAFQLRTFMVSQSCAVLNHLGIPTTQDGTTLVSAATSNHTQGSIFNLNIDGPCSGIRSLFALLMAGALAAYLCQRTLWRRVLLFTTSVPLAIAANMLRILALVAGSMIFGQDFAVGRGEEFTSTFHFLAGLLTFGIAFGGLVLGARFFNKFFGHEAVLPFQEK